MLIGVLRTGKENPEIMARGYVIDAASLDGEVDITILNPNPESLYLNVALRSENYGLSLDFWEKYQSSIDDTSMA